MKIVGDLYVVVTDLQKDVFLFGTHVASAAVAVLQLIELLRNRLGHLNLKDSSAETLNVLEKKRMKDVIDIPHLEDSPILPDL